MAPLEKMEYAQAFFVYVAAVKAADALTVLGIWYACWYLRFSIALFPITKGLPAYRDYSEIALPLVLVFVAVFHMVGAYRRDRIHLGFRPVKKIVQGSVLGTLVFTSICYFLDKVDYSRVFLLLFTALAAVALVGERVLLHLLWNFFESSVVRPIRVLLVGDGLLLEMYIEKLQRRRPYPLQWVGRLSRSGQTTSAVFGAIPVLGDENQLLEAVRNQRPDAVVVSYSSEGEQNYQQILEPLSNELVAVKVLPDFGRYSTFTYSAEQELGIPLLVFNQAPTGATDRALKRAIDIVGSAAFLLVFSPVYLAIALLIKLTSKGPIVYRQERMGADGILFHMYKFRSMVENAEAVSGAVWAVEGDPRTTRLGKLLRRSSLDEIPQFFNVLKGDMSLVGPRPERPVFVDQFRREIPKYMLRHKMKSGITGWAQINGWRGNTSLEERIKHDLYYIGHWSPYFDIKILVLTAFKGFFDRHAY